jgi:hypothetical protein
MVGRYPKPALRVPAGLNQIVENGSFCSFGHDALQMT